MRCFLSHYSLVLIALAAIAQPQPARDHVWPCFLGPNRNGISTETGLNVDWNKKPPKVLWKVPLGKGFSSLAIVQGKIYTMTERNKRQLVVCLDADSGKELWARDLAPGYLDVQRMGPGPRATPTYHDGKLYCLFPLGQ